MPNDSDFPAQAASHHDHGVETTAPDWRPVGKTHRFHDYTTFSIPWLSSAGAIGAWLSLAYVGLRLGDALVGAFTAVGALLLTVVAYAGWLPKQRVEIDLVGRLLLRIASSNDPSFVMSLDDIHRIEVETNKEDVSRVMALPMRKPIFSAKSPQAARRTAQKICDLIHVPFRDTSEW